MRCLGWPSLLEVWFPFTFAEVDGEEAEEEGGSEVDVSLNVVGVEADAGVEALEDEALTLARVDFGQKVYCQTPSKQDSTISTPFRFFGADNRAEPVGNGFPGRTRFGLSGRMSMRTARYSKLMSERVSISIDEEEELIPLAVNLGSCCCVWG